MFKDDWILAQSQNQFFDCFKQQKMAFASIHPKKLKDKKLERSLFSVKIYEKTMCFSTENSLKVV